MIKNLLRATTAAALALVPLALFTPAAHAAETVPIAVAVSRLAVETESRAGYDRDAFKHWNSGLNATDGCNTRAEVLIAEAVSAPAVGARCALTGGSWWSYYDDTTVTSASGLDIDHMVPLAEAWDSGASGWTAARREAYANDQGAQASLVAVTARSNRSKSDQDPAEWLPPSADALCRYVSEWTATKLRWNLAIDESEQDRLYFVASGCTDTTVTYEPAP
ncbi:HNH endonuclease family protein [Streptomyces albipurpureus]|uniref:HNH endonuclease family protein n=1 Tax=Streptomyces albipurpureus TaxID=2897419 RepID=A0ABT0UR67_9ACTN|nr:HNH endonuclease family protein [Streptomyces sp. CWNU-1]MCM2390915.1 HNH endonuclease family protein [Streptomyces sp. CWNU-1]